MPPPSFAAWFIEMVLFSTVALPAVTKTPPPSAVERFLAEVELVNSNIPVVA